MSVNNDPIATNDSAKVDEDKFIIIKPLANDKDVDKDKLTITEANAENGTVIINKDGTLKYTPNANFNGEDIISYSVSDGKGGESTAEVMVTVKAVNDLPTLVVQTVAAVEDTALNITLLEDLTDVDGDALTITKATAAHGAVVINTDGTVTYTPKDNYNGADTISYTVSDGHAVKTSTVKVNVVAVNDDPIATNDSAKTIEDKFVIIKPLANDKDVDKDKLTITEANAENGTVIINKDGTLKYTPNANFNGEDIISYSVSDGKGGESTAEVMVTVKAVNDKPTDISLDNNSVLENIAGAVIGEITTTDVDDESFTYTVSDKRFEVVDGNLKLKDGVSLDYEIIGSNIPLKVTVKDSANNIYAKAFNIAVTDVNENVNPNNHAPIANSDIATVEPWYDDNNQQDVNITSATLNATLSNVSLTVGKAYSDSYATLKMTSATAGTVTASDGLNIAVRVVNGELVGTYEDTTFKYKLLAGDTNTITLAQTDISWKDAMNSGNRQGPPEFWSLMSSSETADALPTSGEITVYNYGDITGYGDYDGHVKSVVNFTDKTIQDYDINGNLQHQETFTVASDGKTMLINGGDEYNENSSTQVQIMSNINGKMVFKIVEHNEYSWGEGSANGNTTIKAWLNENDNYIWRDEADGSYMKVIFNSNGTVKEIEAKYHDEEDIETESGSISSDGKSITVIQGDGTEKYTINTTNNSIDVVNNWNEIDFGSTTQLINYTSDAVDYSTSTIIDVLANDTDADGDVLSITEANAQHGAVIINNDGTLTYKPQRYFEGEDTITYTVSDGQGGVDTETVSVAVGEVANNNAPEFYNYNKEVEFSNVTLNGTLENVNIAVGEEYNFSEGGDIKLKMTSATAGEVYENDIKIIDATITDGVLSMEFKGQTYHYKMLAGGTSDAMILVQSDSDWTNVLSDDTSKFVHGPGGIMPMMKSTDTADVLPTTGKITLHNFDEGYEYGQDVMYEFKTVIDFDAKTITAYSIDGTVTKSKTFTVDGDDKTMHIGDDTLQLMSKSGDTYIFNATSVNDWDQGSANGYTNIDKYFKEQRNDYLWQNSDGSYRKLVRDANGVVIGTVDSDGDENTANVANGVLTITYGDGYQSYKIENGNVMVHNVDSDTRAAFANEPFSYDYTIVNSPMEFYTSENTIDSWYAEATDADGDTLTYTLSGDDAGLFEMSGTNLSFKTAPDYEHPTDAGADNVYNVTVNVSDGKGGTDAQDVVVRVANAGGDVDYVLRGDNYWGVLSDGQWLDVSSLSNIPTQQFTGFDSKLDTNINEIRVTLQDVIDHGFLIDGSDNKALAFIGGTEDEISIIDGWTKDGSITHDGTTYDIYTSNTPDGHELYIQQGMQVM